MNSVQKIYTSSFVSLSLHFNSLSFGVNLIVANNDFFQPLNFEISVIPWTWRGANVNLIPTKADLSITNYETLWRLFNEHNNTHYSSFVVRCIFDWQKKFSEWQNMRIFPIMSSPFLSFLWNAIYREARFFSSFFVRRYLITASCTQSFYTWPLIFFMIVFKTLLLSKKSREC